MSIDILVICIGFCFIITLVCIYTMIERIEELEQDVINRGQREAMLQYSIDSLMKEIDFHLHANGEELSNSYFANCEGIRKLSGKDYSGAFAVWGMK
jgi:hypothetical protein